jgi:hypothetical protein
MDKLNRMSREQTEKLYKIVKTDLDRFYLAMKDSWSARDFAEDEKLRAEYNQMMREYIEQYGDLPKTEYHDEQVALLNQLKQELGI